MVNFSRRIETVASNAAATILSEELDSALVAKTRAEYEATRGSGAGDVAAKRIGAGYIGTECGRELGFRYHKYPKEEREGPVGKGELQRHAEAGFWTEAKTAEWMRLIGIEMNTDTGRLNTFGKPEQIGWKAARDPDTGQSRMAGEVDGVIVAVTNPRLVGLIRPPCIWESKKATDKKWKKFSNETVKKADPRYYGQLQINMAYLGAEQTLFSMLNLDNMKYYWELIPFDAAHAQALSDRAVTVLQSDSPFDMPQLGRAEDDFRCKFCDYHGQCWRGLVLKQEATHPAAQAPGSPHSDPIIRHAAAQSRVFNPNWNPNT